MDLRINQYFPDYLFNGLFLNSCDVNLFDAEVRSMDGCVFTRDCSLWLNLSPVDFMWPKIIEIIEMSLLSESVTPYHISTNSSTHWSLLVSFTNFCAAALIGVKDL